MLAKIKYFPTEAPKPDISGPLSANAELTDAYIVRNGHKLYFQKLSLSEAVIQYPSIDVDGAVDGTVIVADLYSDEDLTLMSFNIHDEFATHEYTSTGANVFVLTITSEDLSTVSVVSFIKHDIGTVTSDAYLYSAASLTEHNTVSEHSEDCRVYQSIHVVDANNESNTADVGIIHMPFTYVTTSFDSGVPITIDAVSLSLRINADVDVEYIAFDTDGDNLPHDPDGETLIDDVTDAMLLPELNGREFTDDEAYLLDQAYVYVVITNTITLQSVYYKLIKTAEYNIQTAAELLKTQLSDTYGCIFLNDIYVAADTISNAQFQIISRQTTALAQIQYLDSQNIVYYDLSANYTEFVDQTITDQINADTRYSSYNTLYDDAATYGFSADDILNMRKPFAQLFYDILILLIDVDDNYLYPASVQFMQCIIDDAACIVDKTYLTTTTKSSIVIDVKAAMLNEIANSAWMLQHMNIRQFRWMQTRIVYLLDQIQQNILHYNMSVSSMHMINTMLTDMQIVQQNLTAMPSYLESAVYSLFNELELLIASDDVLQPINW